MFRIFFETSDTMSLLKQSTLVFLLQKLSTPFTAPAPTIRVWGPVVSSFCSLLVFDLVSYLSLELEDEPSFRESGFWESGANPFSSRIPVSWDNLLVAFVGALVHGFFFFGCGGWKDIPVWWQCRQLGVIVSLNSYTWGLKALFLFVCRCMCTQQHVFFLFFWGLR